MFHPTVIECQSVCKAFADGDSVIKAIDQVDLQVYAGEFICLYGASGSGKTTLLNLIGGLDRPSSGEVFLDKHPLSHYSDDQLTDLRLHKIGFIFQSYNLVPVFSALENVSFILQMQGLSNRDAINKSEYILQQVGLQNLMHRRPAELSGGQQQRVAIARAIVAQPKIILADEPTANLDSKNSEQLMNLMHQLNRDLGSTFVISSHDPQVIEKAERKIELADGKILHDSAD
ncbi:ABC transporter ATP-binding protein [Thiosulfatimonas sediminis]|uniref:ABC transporter ATP-binding protein n=1 Tax=Thiosulfatimonas sediminis TaxID=2675054 RepID=A0A6F8PRG0_9GAMM|nr:ABC transporter ATP-binding protein [Thiosulfatimonas sediminis]BBP44699.1 ABC transporter ATP-binding protein [Thiosulfatimonas sediminis]